jgi:hypothetical protein
VNITDVGESANRIIAKQVVRKWFDVKSVAQLVLEAQLGE